MRFMLNSTICIEIPTDSAEASIISVASKINQFSAEDVGCIRDLWRESLQSETDPERYHFLVAKDGERIVGFACYGHRPLTQGTFDFYWLGVDPGFQKRGIGRSLMTAVEEKIISLKGYLIILETSGMSSFSIPRAIYETFGYKLVAEIPDFYKPGDGLVIYTKLLTPLKK
jgi:ribosomal protein S18 acetylase RimI-like enzyme